jgi:hypothetical protein
VGLENHVDVCATKSEAVEPSYGAVGQGFVLVHNLLP